MKEYNLEYPYDFIEHRYDIQDELTHILLSHCDEEMRFVADDGEDLTDDVWDDAIPSKIISDLCVWYEENNRPHEMMVMIKKADYDILDDDIQLHINFYDLTNKKR